MGVYEVFKGRCCFTPVNETAASCFLTEELEVLLFGGLIAGKGPDW